MTQSQKMFWLVMSLIGIGLAFMLAGCQTHHINVPLPPVRIQETTNNLPPHWPSDSDSGRGVSPLSVVGDQSRDGSATMARIEQAQRDANADLLGAIFMNRWAAGMVPSAVVIVTWTNGPTPRRWPGSSVRRPESYYFSALSASTNLVDWIEVARLPYASTCSYTAPAMEVGQFFRPFNGIK